MTVCNAPVPQLLKQREEDARQQAAHSAVILQRAEAERRRISDKYTRQRAQAKEMLEDFKRVRGSPQAVSHLNVGSLPTGTLAAHGLRGVPHHNKTLPVVILVCCCCAGNCAVTAGDPRAVGREHSAAGTICTGGFA